MPFVLPSSLDNDFEFSFSLLFSYSSIRHCFTREEKSQCPENLDHSQKCLVFSQTTWVSHLDCMHFLYWTTRRFGTYLCPISASSTVVLVKLLLHGCARKISHENRFCKCAAFYCSVHRGSNQGLAYTIQVSVNSLFSCLLSAAFTGPLHSACLHNFLPYGLRFVCHR